MRDPRSAWAIMILFALAGAAVRAWGIWSEPLWLDEAYSAYAADHGFAFLWHVVPHYETHPPFYYSLLHIWVRLFGDSLGALRIPGLIAGLATPPMLVLAAREAASWLGWDEGRRYRLYVAVFGLACFSSALVEMTRQVRPYPLMILGYATAIALMLRLARLRLRGRPLVGRAFAAYFFLLESLLWLHNLGPLFALALTVALAVALLGQTRPRGDLVWLAAAHLVAVLLYLPALAILREQAPAWVAHTWLGFALDRRFLGHLAMLFAAPGLPGLTALLLASFAVAGLAHEQTGRRIAAMLLILALLPVVLAAAISLAIAPVFITRVMSPAAAPAILLLGLGAAAWDGRGRLIGMAAAILLGAAMLVADVQARRAGPMQDWYGAVSWLASRFRSGDAILAYPNEGALPLTYALRDKGLHLPIQPIPTAVPSPPIPGGQYPNGSRGVVLLPPEQLHAIARAPATQGVPTVWLLRLGADTYDPGDVFLRDLHQERYIVRSWCHGPIDLVGLRRRPAPDRSPR